MAKKKITIEGLATRMEKGFESMAAMVKRGFDGMATKDDLKGMATKDDLKLVMAELDRMNSDVHDIKITLGPLVRIAAGHDREIQELRFRVNRLERKTGIGR